MRLQRRLCTKQNQMYANDCSRAWFLLVSSTLPWSWSTAAGWEPQFQQDSGHDFLLLVRSTHHWFVLLHHRSCCWLLVLLSVRALRFHRSLPSCSFVLSFAVTSVPASFGAFQRANSTRPIISYTLIQRDQRHSPSFQEPDYLAITPPRGQFLLRYLSNSATHRFPNVIFQIVRQTLPRVYTPAA